MKTERENFPFRDSGFCSQCGVDFDNHLRTGTIFRVFVRTIEDFDVIYWTICDSYKMKIDYDN